MKVLVLFGGPSPEREISFKTAESVSKALRNLGHEVIELEYDETLPFKLLKVNPDKVFIAMHGVPGEDGSVQGLLECMGIDYTGCGVQSSAICMDKDATKRILKTHGISVPEGESFYSLSEVNWVEFPCVVKPARTGSTVGISVVKGEEEFEDALIKAFRYDRKILIEEFIQGRELTVSVLNGKALPIVEIIPEGGFYDYSAKYEKSTTRYEVPANLHPRIEQRIRKDAERIFKILECRGAVRIDLRLSERGMPFFLEVNTIPGMTERSLLPKAAKAAGMSFEELIDEILRG